MAQREKIILISAILVIFLAFFGSYTGQFVGEGVSEQTDETTDSSFETTEEETGLRGVWVEDTSVTAGINTGNIDPMYFAKPSYFEYNGIEYLVVGTSANYETSDIANEEETDVFLFRREGVSRWDFVDSYDFKSGLINFDVVNFSDGRPFFYLGTINGQFYDFSSDPTFFMDCTNTEYRSDCDNSNYPQNYIGFTQKNLIGNKNYPSYLSPSYFNLNENEYIIAGTSSGEFIEIGGTDSKVNGLNEDIDTPLANDPSAIQYSDPDIIQYKGTWYLITGDITGGFTGFEWDGSRWVKNSAITKGLSSMTGFSSPSLFKKEGSLYIIAGDTSGNIIGYRFIDENFVKENIIKGNEGLWIEDTSITTGLPLNDFDVNANFVNRLEVSQVNGYWYLINGQKKRSVKLNNTVNETASLSCFDECHDLYPSGEDMCENYCSTRIDVESSIDSYVWTGSRWSYQRNIDVETDAPDPTVVYEQNVVSPTYPYALVVGKSEKDDYIDYSYYDNCEYVECSSKDVKWKFEDGCSDESCAAYLGLAKSDVVISYSTPDSIQREERIHYIIGNKKGDFLGQSESSGEAHNPYIVEGLGDVGSHSDPEAFQKHGNWFLISGSESGYYHGFEWDGSQWWFDHNSEPLCIPGETDNECNGEAWDPESKWKKNDIITLGLETRKGNSSIATFFMDGNWFAITGSENGIPKGYRWIDSSTAGNVLSVPTPAEGASLNQITDAFLDHIVDSVTGQVKYQIDVAGNLQTPIDHHVISTEPKLITFSWFEPRTRDPTLYKDLAGEIQISLTNSFAVPIKTIKTTGVSSEGKGSITASGLTPNTKYCVRSRLVNNEFSASENVIGPWSDYVCDITLVNIPIDLNLTPIQECATGTENTSTSLPCAW